MKVEYISPDSIQVPLNAVEILDGFGDTLAALMGQDEALNTLQFLTKVMRQNPEMARKLMQADRWKKMGEAFQRRQNEKAKGSKGFMGRMDDLAFAGELKDIFKDLL